MAQRLLRVICPECKRAYQPRDLNAVKTELQKLHSGAVKLYQGAGCEACLSTGYTGRTAIFELLVMDDDIKDLVIQRQGAHVIKQAALAKGMTTLRQDGLRRVLAGMTTLEEVYRVTQDSVKSNAGVTERADR
jgi:type II secretory ATPase GspE/PulE/Tfp pilus assembly ATPase PilB-like protein